MPLNPPKSDTLDLLIITFPSRPLTAALAASSFIHSPLLLWAVNNLPHRPRSSPQSTPQSVSRLRPPSSLQLAPDACNILDIVFRKMRSRLEQRHSSLTDRIQAITHNSDGTLSETDIRKVSRKTTSPHTHLYIADIFCICNLSWNAHFF